MPKDLANHLTNMVILYNLHVAPHMSWEDFLTIWGESSEYHNSPYKSLLEIINP